MKRHLQAATSASQQPDRHADLVREPEYLLTAEASTFCRFDTKADGTPRPLRDAMRLFYKWAARNRVPQARRGRTLLYDKRVLAAFLEQRDWTKRHADTVAPSSPFRPRKSVDRKEVA